MLEGYQKMITGMSREMTRLNVLAENMANSSTPGFKATRTGLRQGEFKSWLDRKPGLAVHTGNPTDIRLPKDVYLVVAFKEGTRLSKRGDLTRDAEGFLTTGSGYRVLSEANRPIYLGNSSFKIAPDGKVYADNKPIATLARVKVKSVLGQGGELFTPASQSSITPDTSPIYVGGYEDSNVDPIQEATELVETVHKARLYQEFANVQEQLVEEAFKEFGPSR